MDIHNDILIQSIEASNLAHTISTTEGDMPLTYVNQAFLEQTGYTRDEVIGRNCRFLQGEGTNPDTVEHIRQAIRDHRAIDIEILNYRKDGRPFWNRLRMAPVFQGEDQTKPVAFLGIQSDVTAIRENLRLEQERQKLEALGRMSANVSHEIKNAIQPVQLMAETLFEWETLSKDQMKQCVQIIYDNINIAKNVTQDVLRFSKPAGDQTETIPVRTLADNLTRFTRNLLNSRVEFETDIQAFPDDTAVKINQSQLHQVALNLINNALHAMNESGRFTLSITSQTVQADDAAAAHVKNGEYIGISFEDDGCGMDEKTCASVFEPFFSTKPPGDGTGLGLSISYKIIKSWGGTMTVRSTQGQGSVFSVLLPRAEPV